MTMTMTIVTVALVVKTKIAVVASCAVVDGEALTDEERRTAAKARFGKNKTERRTGSRATVTAPSTVVAS